MKLKIGVLGAGHLGKIHLNCINQQPNIYDLVGFYDPNEAVAQQVSKELGYKSFSSIDEILDAVDVIDIVTPTLSHYECAKQAIAKGKHFFIEKPITETMAQAEELIEEIDRLGIKAQVGHVERFNPAFLACKDFINEPMFIESHRLAEFNPRGTDVPVVMDLMIHDIDVVMSIVNSPVKSINASGVGVVSETADICNARIEFENGCVANLTASRISMKNMRKTRLFQRDAYITVDFLKKATEIVRMDSVSGEIDDPFAMVLDLPNGDKKRIFFENPDVEPNNAILEELKSFGYSITNNTTPQVPLTDGYNALSVATQIMQAIENAPKIDA